MNFFERQRQVRRMSGRLVLLFVLAVIAIVVVIDAVLLFAFRRSLDESNGVMLVIITSIAVLASIGLAALFRTVSLRGGGGVVARGVGGVLVSTDTQDPQLRRLRNVVEEIAIASGVAVPEVYVLPNESGINAFAAGWSPNDAAVAVTRGALERLNRAELQGVIAHEFSHVVNGDMRLNIKLIGLLFGILFLAVIGRTFTNVGIIGGAGRSRNDRSQGNPLVIVGITLLVVGGIGVFFGRLIKAAVSRQREYLADASAVQYTRQTSGLVGALAKIGGLASGSQLRNPRREEVGHMLFGAGASFSSLFATHPPLLERIKALDPTFDRAKLEQLARQWAAQPPSGLAEDAAMGFAETPSGAAPGAPLPAPQEKVPVAEANIVAGIAAPSEGAYERAGQLMAQIPDEVLQRAHRPDQAPALVLGLLMAEDAEARAAQRSALTEKYGAEVGEGAWAQAQELAGLHPLLRLPLAELALPALRQLTVPDQVATINQMFTLVNADGRVTAYEYCLSRLVYSAITESQQPSSRWRGEHNRLHRSPEAVATLLAVLAQAGNDDPGAAQRAFDAGVAKALPGARLGYAPPAGVTALEPVWPALAGLSPEDTQRLVEALVAVISSDGVATVTELELLRTICAILHAPLPL